MFGMGMFWRQTPKLNLPEIKPLEPYDSVKELLKIDEQWAEYRRVKAERDMNRGYEG